MLINFVDATNDANHYTKPPPARNDEWVASYSTTSSNYPSGDSLHVEYLLRMRLSMGARRHRQGVTCPPLEMLFCVLVVTAKRPVNEFCMHYFHKLSLADGSSPRTRPCIPLGDFLPRTPNLPTPGKNPTCAHASLMWSQLVARYVYKLPVYSPTLPRL